MHWITTRSGEPGVALMGSMVIALALVALSVTMLELVWQESLSADAGGKAAVAQQLADAAAEMVIGWFHDPETSPRHVSGALEKHFLTSDGAPTFFDHNGRSQFTGSADRPDVLLNGTNPADDRLLNDPDVGSFRAMTGSGTVRLLKIYAPFKPGSLCTVEVTVGTRHPTSFQQTISMQLEALELPALRMGMQAGRSLGLRPDGRSVGGVHWASVAVGENLVIRRIEDLPTLNPAAAITGQSYDESLTREDRWTHMWVGGDIQETEPASDSAQNRPLPPNVHQRQHPTPGIRFDRWNYEQLKQTAMRFGRYYVVDGEGLLYQAGRIEPGQGLSPDQVFGSQRVGDQLGLIFVDTLDRTAPHGDNLASITLNMEYFEGVAVIQGHVRLNPSSAGQGLKVQSPRLSDNGSSETVHLTGVRLNGVLYAAGDITIGRPGKVYGTVIAEGHIRSANAGATLEVWHDDAMSRGFFRGVPVVYRVPGTWIAHY